jgi:L-amino acid N-acyltransferase YncA
MKIRPAIKADRDAIWKIFHQIVVAGDTYAFGSNMSREEASAYWFRSGTRTYIAENVGRVVGTYILRPNQLGPGSHVANTAFMVPSEDHGCGVGRAMAEHCLSEARRMGFAPCNLTSLSLQTRQRFIFGSSWVLKSLVICPALFGILKKDTSMFTSCYRSLLP